MKENNINKYKKGYTNFLLTAALACTFSQMTDNENKFVQEKEINIQTEDEDYKNNKLQKAQEIITRYEENNTTTKDHTINLSITEKLQIIKINNNTKNTSNYHIIGTVSDINKETGKLEYILIDMITLKPLYKLNDNKEVVGETDEISYSEKSILFDYLMQLGYIKKQYKSTELNQIITFINSYTKNESNMLKK